MGNREGQNKANAQAFYDMMFNRSEPRRAIEKYVGDVYIQHNPEVADGKEPFIDCFGSISPVPRPRTD